MTPEKIDQLRLRMQKHSVVADVAVVVLTAKELEDLLNLAEKQLIVQGMKSLRGS